MNSLGSSLALADTMVESEGKSRKSFANLNGLVLMFLYRLLQYHCYPGGRVVSWYESMSLTLFAMTSKQNSRE